MTVMNKIFKCHKISEGQAEGEVLFSKDGICFYLIDPKTGVVIQRNHSLFGKSVAGKILVYPFFIKKTDGEY